MAREESLWVEKYRPQKIADCILPAEIKATFQEYVNKNVIPNMLLNSGPGMGKTTVAKALCNELDVDCLVINASMNGGIDTLRNEIKNFASTVSFNGGRKCVILDEADHLTPQTQAAMRNFMEEFSSNCAFILTSNYKNKIIEPLHSRCVVFDFKISNSIKANLATQFMKRIGDILTQEGIEYDKGAVAETIMKFFPDWRRVLNELQAYSISGKIDSGILANFNDDSFKSLVGLVKAKKWKEMRKWVGENIDNEPVSIMRRFYEQSFDILQPSSIPTLVLLIADYQYKDAFVADGEINLVAFLTQCMSELEWQ